MNVIIDIINKQLGTIWCNEVCHGSYYYLIEMGSDQPSILTYLTLSEYSSTEIVRPFKDLLCVTAHPQFLVLKEL